MTAKEKLHQVVESLSEPEAEQMLDYIARQHRRDPLVELLDNAPPDDEPKTAEEDEGVQEARAEYGRGEVFTAEEIRREIAERRLALGLHRESQAGPQETRPASPAPSHRGARHVRGWRPTQGRLRKLGAQDWRLRVGDWRVRLTGTTRLG